MQITYEDNRFKIWCDTADNKKMRAVGFAWDKESRSWQTTHSSLVAKIGPHPLVDAKLSVEKQFMCQSYALDSSLDVPCPPELSYYNFQIAGIESMLCRRKSLLADEMGIGKTIQIIGMVNYLGIRNILIIPPPNLRINWCREFYKWNTLGLSACYCFSSYWPDTNVVVCPYNLLPRFAQQIYDRDWDLIGADESQFLKNPKTIRTQEVVGSNELFPLDAEWKVAISGTPIVNRPIEMFTTLKWIDPIGWPTRSKFGGRYCQNTEPFKRFADEYMGASNLDELQIKLRGTIMIRRMKKDALPQLPPKVRQIIEIDPGTKAKKLLTMFEREQGIVNLGPEEFRQVVKHKMGACDSEWFDNISGFRRELGLTKLPHIIEHVEEAVKMSGKVLVGCWHREVVDELLNHFTVERAVRVYGNTSMIGKEQAKDRFQTDQGCQVFIGNILSAGIGLTLTASSHVIFAELDYVPGNMTQFEDRAHRITQPESVLIQHLVYANSIDAHMTKVQVEKQENIDKAVNIN